MSRPVVRVRLECNYCAHVFLQSFTVDDQIRAQKYHECDNVRFCLHPPPQNIANVVRTATKTIPQGWFRAPLTVTEFVRVGVPCVNCGSSTRYVSRQPLTVGAA